MCSKTGHFYLLLTFHKLLTQIIRFDNFHFTTKTE